MLADWPAANHQIRVFIKHCPDKLHDIPSRILIITICVYQNIRIISQGIFHPSPKCGSEPHIVWQTHNIINAKLLGNAHGFISGTIVNDLRDNTIYPVNVLWKT
ncbi:hypothetical protein JCM14635_38950 [Megalodesulfovibrio paquesii]